MRDYQHLYPPVFPVPRVTHDRFGIPTYTLLGEDDEAREKRHAMVRDVIVQLFKTAVNNLGEEEARHLFVKAAKRPRGKHGKRRALSPDRDWMLLREYHAEADQSSKIKSSVLRSVSERIFRENGNAFGASAAAIEKQIRRLLADRKRRADRDAARSRQWKERYKAVTGVYPVSTILGLTTAEDDTDKK